MTHIDLIRISGSSPQSKPDRGGALPSKGYENTRRTSPSFTHKDRADLLAADLEARLV